MKDLRRAFSQAEERLVEESRRLKAAFDRTYDSDYDASLSTVQRMLDVFSDLKVLQEHKDGFLGVLDAHERVTLAVDALTRQLEDLAAPLGELRGHLKRLSGLDVSSLERLLGRETGETGMHIELPTELDPLLMRLATLFPDVLGEDSTGCLTARPLAPPRPEPEPEIEVLIHTSPGLPVAECAPAVEEELPAVEDELPAVEDELPAVEDELPAVEEELPAVEDELPAVEEELPAVEDELPAVEDEFPAVEEEPAAGADEFPAVESGEAMGLDGLEEDDEVEVSNAALDALFGRDESPAPVAMPAPVAPAPMAGVQSAKDVLKAIFDDEDEDEAPAPLPPAAASARPASRPMTMAQDVVPSQPSPLSESFLDAFVRDSEDEAAPAAPPAASKRSLLAAFADDDDEDEAPGVPVAPAGSRDPFDELFASSADSSPLTIDEDDAVDEGAAKLSGEEHAAVKSRLADI